MKHLALIVAVGVVGIFFMVASEARNNAYPFEGQSGGTYMIVDPGTEALNPCHCDSRSLGSTPGWQRIKICERSCNAYTAPNCPAGCLAR